MSKFFTAIPVDVEAVTKLLPQGAFVEAIRWNAQARQVEIVWDHDPFYTGLDFAASYSSEELAGGKRPNFIRERPRRDQGTKGLKDQGTNARTVKAKSV